MNVPDFLHRTDQGTYRFVGHRIDLYHVVTLYANGHTPAMIHEDLPTLPLGLIEKTIAYYEKNKTEIDVYVRGWEREYERLSQLTKGGPSTEELRRRFAALRPAESA